MIPVCLICLVQQKMKEQWIFYVERSGISQCNSSTLIYIISSLMSPCRPFLRHFHTILFAPKRWTNLTFSDVPSPFMRNRTNQKRNKEKIRITMKSWFQMPRGLFQAWQSSKAPNTIQYHVNKNCSMTSALLLVKCSFGLVFDSL